MKDSTILIPAYLGKLFAQAALPKWAIAVAAGVFDYVLPKVAPGVAMAAFGLVILDTLTGIVRARVSGFPVTSAKLSRFLTKAFSYSIAVLAIAFAVHIVPDTQPLQPLAVTTTITGIAVTETYSIFENLKAIGYTPPKVVSDLLDKVFAALPKGGDKK